MYAATATVRDLSTVSLHNAVFCVDCETISNSPHDICTVCGSPSLIGLFKLLGGTLRQHGDQPKSVRYHLELEVDAQEVSAYDLNRAIDLATSLAAAGAVIKKLHVEVEPVAGEELPLPKAA